MVFKVRLANVDSLVLQGKWVNKDYPVSVVYQVRKETAVYQAHRKVTDSVEFIVIFRIHLKFMLPLSRGQPGSSGGSCHCVSVYQSESEVIKNYTKKGVHIRLIL